MTWGWSHTDGAYASAERNLGRLPDVTLAQIWAEWKAYKSGEFHSDFNEKTYGRELRRAHSLIRRQGDRARESLRWDVWDKAADQALCTNGGWEAHLCPFACGCHLVPFDDPKEGPTLTLGDDGTMDTVFSCDDCGEEIRYSDMSEYRDESGTLSDEGLAFAEEEHADDCPENREGTTDGS